MHCSLKTDCTNGYANINVGNRGKVCSLNCATLTMQLEQTVQSVSDIGQSDEKSEQNCVEVRQHKLLHLDYRGYTFL